PPITPLFPYTTLFRSRGIQHSDTLEVALLLEPVFKVGQTFELEKIYYDFDQYAIRPDAAEVLDELVRTMRDNPSLKIELSSHTRSEEHTSELQSRENL